MYSELVYFEGAYFAHIVARQEHARIEAIHAQGLADLARACLNGFWRARAG
jgi:hypothetical protein